MSKIISDYLRAEIEAKTNATIEVLSKQLDASLQERNSLRAENERLTRSNAGLHDEVQFMRKAAKENRERAQATEKENERLTTERDEARSLYNHQVARAQAAEAREAKAGEKIEAAREFVKRHPALTLIDLAEFEAFLKVPDAICALESRHAD